jgi:hypothetical protein
MPMCRARRHACSCPARWITNTAWITTAVRFYVRSNKDGKNFGLYETKESPVDRWKAVIAPIRTCCWRAMPCSGTGWCWRSAARG